MVIQLDTSYPMLVMGSDSERALEIKEKWNAYAESRQTVEIRQWICKCGKTVDQGLPSVGIVVLNMKKIQRSATSA